MRKIFYVLIVLIALIFTACGGKQTDKKVAKKGENSVNGVKQELIFNLGADPKTLDPQLNSAIDGAIVINNTFEGLTRTDAKGKIQLVGATSYELSPDKTVYTFHLRKDAKWSDGKPVIAKDYKYAWLRALNPKVGSEYAFQLFYLKGGQNYFEGKGKKENVGIKIVDDYTLKVTLKAPTSYFLNLLSLAYYFPVREDVVNKKPEGWAKDAKIAVSNGPFILSKYQINNKIVLVPNKYYWNRKSVKLNKVVLTMIVDGNTALTAYDNNEIDIMRTVPIQEIGVRMIEDPTLHIVPQLAVYYYIFNVAKAPTNNINVRKALSLAIDREKIVTDITKAGQLPATGMVPPGLFDSTGKDFRKTAGNYGLTDTANVKKAREYLAKAGYPNGKGMPKTTLIYNTNDNHKAIAEAIQQMWKKNLGIEVELVNQEWAVFQDTRHQGNFQIARGGWIGDYQDPMTFLDLFTSYSGNNDSQWNYKKGNFPGSKKFDHLIEDAKISSGVKRDKDMYAAEKLMMDKQIVSPLYYYTTVYMMKPKVKGIELDILGIWYFGNAYIVKADKK